jgi:UDP-N-acetylmuramyl pentapeptide phosphotransferase/UDP-N-acetylglucosamine-1-phosphate transferase
VPAHSFLFDWIAEVAAAGVLAYSAIALAFRWLVRHAVAIPNPRSSHIRPTPQGGGIVVIPVALIVAAAALALAGAGAGTGSAPLIAAALGALALCAVGFIDDVRGLSIAPRLIVQVLAVAAATATLPTEFRLFPTLVPLALERVVLFAAVFSFLNIYNFMDGIDWISAVETAAITFGVAVLAGIGAVPVAHGYIAAALFGAIAGFAPWNAPPARLFLGDAGSAPLGFLLGLLLLYVALSGAMAAAVILPLYYLADGAITIGRRAVKGEAIWQAHRSHFYQVAIQRGLTVRQTVGRIALANAVLVALAVVSALATTAISVIALLVAGATVAATLHRLAKGRP